VGGGTKRRPGGNEGSDPDHPRMVGAHSNATRDRMRRVKRILNREDKKARAAMTFKVSAKLNFEPPWVEEGHGRVLNKKRLL